MSTTNPTNVESAIQRQFGCDSVLRGAVAVREQFLPDAEVWKGTVLVFDLKGHSTSTKCYAWSSPSQETRQLEVVAVLHDGAVTSPRSAVRAHLSAQLKGEQDSGSMKGHDPDPTT